MSTENVEGIHIRLRAELSRLGLSMADAGRLIGDADGQALRDVCNGRKRATAELVARLGLATNIDIEFVLTGRQRYGTAVPKATPVAAEPLAEYGAGKPAPLAWPDLLEIVYDGLAAKGRRMPTGKKLRELVDAVDVVLRLEQSADAAAVRRKIEAML